MAETKIELTYTWENDVSMKLTMQENDGVKFTVLDMDENGCIASMWGYIQGIMTLHNANLVARIGTEMKV